MFSKQRFKYFHLGPSTAAEHTAEQASAPLSGRVQEPPAVRFKETPA